MIPVDQEVPFGTSFFLRSKDRTGHAVVIGLLIVGCFILSHPYGGIRHDGILYLGEALFRLDPSRMGSDPFFLFGSQASFTVVPHFYAWLIESIGIGDASSLLLVLSFAAYLLATYFVLSVLLPTSLLPWAMIAVSVAAPVYGGHRVFAYAEPFFTSRSIAEPLVLFAVGCLLRKRQVATVALLAVAAFVHPLVALTGMIFAGCWLVMQDRRWAWATLLLLVVPLLAWLDIAPFGGLFKRYDAEWLAIVQEANPFVFPTEWKLADWGTVGFDVGVAFLTWKNRIVLGHRIGELIVATTAAGLLGIAASLLGADAIGNVLLTSLQLWRAHWLMHWVAVIALVPLVVLLWQRTSPNDRSASLLLLAAGLSLATFAPLCLLPAVVALVLYPARLPVTRVIVMAAGGLCAALTIILISRQLSVLQLFAGDPSASWVLQVSRVLSISALLVPIVAATLFYLRRSLVIGSVVAVALVVLGVAGWDQRSEWTKFQENYAQGKPLLWNDIVGANDRVYWYREVKAPWLMMRHANYFSANQASGVLFNRDTALAIEARGKLTGLLDFQETVCQLMNNLNSNGACEPDINVVHDICHSGDHISFVVLQSLLSVEPVARLRTGIFENELEKTFNLYRCSSLDAG